MNFVLECTERLPVHLWNARPRFAYSLCKFGGSTINVIKVICENNALPCVKKRMSFCACVKSRDLLKVPWMSYCSRFRRSWFNVLNFKCWAYSRIYGHFHQHLYIACAEKLFMNFRCKLRHHRSIPRPRFFWLECKISAIWRRLPLISAYYMLNARHISTSRLFDLLT